MNIFKKDKAQINVVYCMRSMSDYQKVSSLKNLINYNYYSDGDQGRSAHYHLKVVAVSKVHNCLVLYIILFSIPFDQL